MLSQVFSGAHAYALIVRMRTHVLPLLLVLSLLAACKDSKSVDATGPAGKVLSLRGSATASSSEHGERTLVIGAQVYRDDRIVTQEDTAIEIRLDHNGALWSLQGKRDVLVGESPAWRAKLANADVLNPSTNDTTGAAGRHTERVAGQDSSAVDRVKKPEVGVPVAEAEATASDEASAVPGNPEPSAKNLSGKSGDSDLRQGKGGQPERHHGRDSEGGSSVVVKPVGGSDSFQNLASNEEVKFKTSPERELEAAGGADDESTDKASELAPTPELAAASARLQWRIANAEGALAKDVLARVIKSRTGQFQSCLAAARVKKGRFTWHLRISKAGKVESALPGSGKNLALPKELATCFDSALSALVMPGAQTPSQVDATLVWDAP